MANFELSYINLETDAKQTVHFSFWWFKGHDLAIKHKVCINSTSIESKESKSHELGTNNSIFTNEK